MGNDETQDSMDQVDEQGTGEAESSEEQRAAALRRRAREVQGSASVSAPVDDDVIIK